MKKTLAAILLAGIATLAYAQNVTCYTTGNIRTCNWTAPNGTYCTMTCYTTGNVTSCDTYPSSCR